MARSALDPRFEKGDEIIDQIRSEPLERLRRVGDLWKSTLADWEDLAKAEESVQREYRGRSAGRQFRDALWAQQHPLDL
jgi:hypothetical protein